MSSLNRKLKAMLPHLKDTQKWVVCAACGQGTSDLGCHPELDVGFCLGCYDRVMEGRTNINYAKDEEGWELYCRLCGDAGHTVGCDRCEKVNCESCIRRNIGNTAFETITAPGGIYHCFNCAPQGLDPARSTQLSQITRPPTYEEENILVWPEWVESGAPVMVKSYGVWCQGKFRAIYRDEAVCKYEARGQCYQDKFKKCDLKEPGGTKTIQQIIDPRRQSAPARAPAPKYASGATSHKQPSNRGFKLQTARKTMQAHQPAPLQAYGYADERVPTPPIKLQTARKMIRHEQQYGPAQPSRAERTAARSRRNSAPSLSHLAPTGSRRAGASRVPSHASKRSDYRSFDSVSGSFDDPSPTYSGSGGGSGRAADNFHRQRASDHTTGGVSGSHHAPPAKIARKSVELEQNISQGRRGSAGFSVGVEVEPPSKRARMDHDTHEDDHFNAFDAYHDPPPFEEPNEIDLAPLGHVSPFDLAAQPKPSHLSRNANGQQQQRQKQIVSKKNAANKGYGRQDSRDSFYSASSAGDRDSKDQPFDSEPEAERSVDEHANNPFVMFGRQQQNQANQHSFSRNPPTFRSEPTILNEDISEGKENLAIPVIVDPNFGEDDIEAAREKLEEQPKLLYHKEPIWGVNAGVVVPARSLDSCVGCDGRHCETKVTKQELQARAMIPPSEWMQCIKCSWGAYDESGRLLNADGAIWECNMFCQCDVKTCRNRVVQRGISKRLEVFWAGKAKGFGVRCTQRLLCGDFICEYVGEILTSHEADERGLSCGDAYLYFFNPHS